MLRQIRLYRPFVALQSSQTSQQYRLLSTTTPPPPTKYQQAEEDKYAIDRSLKLAKLRKFDDLLSYLNRDPSISKHVFTTLIQHKFGLPTIKEIEFKEQILRIMEKGGMKQDVVIKPFTDYRLTDLEAETLDRMLLLIRSQKFDELFELLKSSSSLSRSVFNRLLQHKFGIVHIREISFKEKIVNIMEERGIKLDAGSIVPLISLYGVSCNVGKADGLFKKMKDEGIERTLAVYNSMINCHERDLPRVESLFQEIIADNIKPNAITYNSMIYAYSKSGKLEKAVEFSSLMITEGIEHNQVTYNTMINVYSKNGDLEKAVQLFTKMIDGGFKPNSLIYNSIISIFGKLGYVERADGILQKMKDDGLARSAPIYNALIKCHERDLTRVASLFKEMIGEGIEPTVITFNTMIHAYTKSGNLGRAIELFARMLKDGVKPTQTTYNSMIHAYSTKGELDEAIELFSRMLEAGIKPNLYIYNSMIAAHAKFGNLESCEQMIGKMVNDGFKPDRVTLGSMRFAYERFGNEKKADEFVGSRVKDGRFEPPAPGEWFKFLRSGEWNAR